MADLLLERNGGIATVTINRPERHNSITLEMFTAVPELLRQIAADDSVHVLVVRGAGGRAFSAGGDISEFTKVRGTVEQTRAYDAAVAAAEEAFAGLPQPTIALIHGHCMGGGCALALACDIRFASATAQFAITPAKLGIVYPFSSTKRLVDTVGPSRAKMILMSAETITAARAGQVGLVDEVFAPEELDGAVAAYAGLIASRAPKTVRSAKDVIERVVNGQSADDAYTAALRDEALTGPDYVEGITAFLEKRAPRFR